MFVINFFINIYVLSFGDVIGGIIVGIVDWLSSLWSGGIVMVGFV